MKLFDYLDKTLDDSYPQVLINVITPEVPSNWISMNSSSVDEILPEYQELLADQDIRFLNISDLHGFMKTRTC